MGEFVLKDSYFEYGRNVYQQISGTAIDAKFRSSLRLHFYGSTQN